MNSTVRNSRLQNPPKGNPKPNHDRVSRPVNVLRELLAEIGLRILPPSKQARISNLERELLTLCREGRDRAAAYVAASLASYIQRELKMTPAHPGPTEAEL